MGFFGIAPRSYGSYFKPVVAPMSDPFGTAGTTNLQIADQLRQNQLEAQNEFQNNDLDDPAVIPALNRLMAAGTIAPSTGKAILSGIRYANPTQRTGAANSRTTPFNDEGTQFLNNLYGIDWTQPNAFQAVPDLLKQYPNALSDPRVSSAMQAVQQHALSYKAPKAPSDDELASLPPHYQAGAAKLLTNLSNYGTNFGNEQSADQVVANRNGILKSVRNLQMIGLSPQRVSAELAFSGLDPNEWMNGTGPSSGYNPSKEEKSTALTQHGIDPNAATPAQWQQSHYWAQGTTMPQQRTQAAASPAPTVSTPTGPSLQGDEFTEVQAPPAAPAPEAHEEPEWNPAPSGFGKVKQVLQEQQETKTKAAADLAHRQAEVAPKWEDAKQEFLNGLPAEEVKNFQMGLPINYHGLTRKAGKNPQDVAFNDENNRPVTWQDVAQQAIKDPRFQTSIGAKAPIATLPSGRKFTAGAPIRTQ